MSYQKGELVYEGKAKKIFNVIGFSDLVWMEFKDSLTAFNAQKKGSFPDKGLVNKKIACLIFEELEKHGVPHHLKEDINEYEVVCESLKIIPLEVVVRNILAGSTAQKFNIKDGTPLVKPLVEFFYKDDELGDPFINDEQALMMKAVADQSELDNLKVFALKINHILLQMFNEIGIQLVDFKLEFGKNKDGQILLGDEITPDSCRLWDKVTGEKLDKDRFRKDLGQVAESYHEVLRRLQQRK